MEGNLNIFKQTIWITLLCALVAADVVAQPGPDGSDGQQVAAATDAISSSPEEEAVAAPSSTFAASSDPLEMILVLGFKQQTGVQWGGRHVTIATFKPQNKQQPLTASTLLSDFRSDPKMWGCLTNGRLPFFNLTKSATSQKAGYQSLKNQGYDPNYARQVEFDSDTLKGLAACIDNTKNANKTWSDRYEIETMGPPKARWHITQYCIKDSKQAKEEYDSWFTNDKAPMRLFLNARDNTNNRECAGAMTPSGKPGKSASSTTTSKNCYTSYEAPRCWAWTSVRP